MPTTNGCAVTSLTIARLTPCRVVTPLLLSQPAIYHTLAWRHAACNHASHQLLGSISRCPAGRATLWRAYSSCAADSSIKRRLSAGLRSSVPPQPHQAPCGAPTGGTSSATEIAFRRPPRPPQTAAFGPQTTPAPVGRYPVPVSPQVAVRGAGAQPAMRPSWHADSHADMQGRVAKRSCDHPRACGDELSMRWQAHGPPPPPCAPAACGSTYRRTSGA